MSKVLSYHTLFIVECFLCAQKDVDITNNKFEFIFENKISKHCIWIYQKAFTVIKN